MKIFLCGFGVAGQKVLIWLGKCFKPTDLAVFTHDDGITGSGLTRLANQLGLWYTTENINTTEWPFLPNVIASVYYRTIIKQPVIDRVQGRIFNAHTSLLPKHRGRSPLSWAIIDGDSITGVTFHYIDKGVDTGPILMQAPVEIAPTETLLSLFDKVNRAVVDFFPAALTLAIHEVDGVSQKGEPSYHSTGVPYGGEIDPGWPIGKIERFIRAMTYPPLPYATFCGKEVKTLTEYLELLHEYKDHNRLAFS